MGNSSQLPSDGRVDLWMIVPMKIGPDGGVGIEIFLAMDVPQKRALARDDDDWLGLQPVAHLCKLMPDVLVIEPGQVMHAAWKSHIGNLRSASAASNRAMSSSV